MENTIQYQHDGVTFSHSDDTIDITFDENIYSALESDQLPADTYAWEVNDFCKSELVDREKAITIDRGFRCNVFDLFSDPFEDESEDDYRTRTMDEYNQLRHIFHLPNQLSGKVELKTSGLNAYDPNYQVRIVYIEKGSGVQRPYETAGLILKTTRNLYRLDYYQLKAFSEYRKYLSKLSYHENDHYNLVGHFKRITGDDITKEENRFQDLMVSEVQKVRLQITELENGDLELSPNLVGSKTKDEDAIRREINLTKGTDTSKTLHVGRELIQVNEQAAKGIKEIQSVGTIKKEEAADFLQNIGSYIDGDKVDLDGFSYRVLGITEYIHTDFVDIQESDNDWFISSLASVIEDFEPFIKSVNELDAFEDKSAKALQNKADQVAFKDRVFELPEKEELEQRIGKLRVDLENKEPEQTPEKKVRKTLTFKIKYMEKAEQLQNLFETYDIPTSTLDHLNYQPYEYQKEAIQWIYSLYRSSINSDREVRGGILADDMGLGKTISSLLGMKAIIEHQKETDREAYLSRNKCFMVVAPLSLLKNWYEEVYKFFDVHPFSDIVILNSQNDLKKFRYEKGIERSQEVSATGPILPKNLKRCLKVGEEFGPGRLDAPGRLILTTYETMRDYQFSLSQMEFYCVIFDEAQKIKNPNTLASRSAKALTSDINIMSTGTPVENNLQEYWCIMDTANPNLFGAPELFNEAFIQPIKENSSDEMKLRVGKELYQMSGPFLLRRSKEELRDVLGDRLPNKYEYKGIENEDYLYLESLDNMLSPKQVQHYDTVLEMKWKDPTLGAALSALHHLRKCMIHPDLTFSNSVEHLANVTRDEFWNESAKLQSLLATLHQIKAKDEKVIIFSLSKSIQYLAKKWLKVEFGLNVDVISGDTKVESPRVKETRLGKIEKFGEKPGFNIIILSPLAAGVGLNVTAANHIFHLERHWNPAKESQANDRAYRIGQTKDVNIYYPIGKHPDFDSFDVKLDNLLSKKTFIKDALITYPNTIKNDLANGL